MNISKIVQECNPFELPSVLLTEYQKLPSCKAVYFVLSQNQVVYIGKTINLKLRWSSHSLNIPLDNQATIAWLTVDSEQILFPLEQELIALFKPQLNKQKPLLRQGVKLAPVINKMAPSELMRRYDIARSVFYERAKRLSIKPHKIGGARSSCNLEATSRFACERLFFA